MLFPQSNAHDCLNWAICSCFYISFTESPVCLCGKLMTLPVTRNFHQGVLPVPVNSSVGIFPIETQTLLTLHGLQFSQVNMLCTKKKHNYFALSCKELYQLKNIIIAVLWAQRSWFLFVILSYYAASLQNYLDRNNYTQCSQIQRITDCSKLGSLILNIYIMLSCFRSLFPWVIYPFPCKFLIHLTACLWRFFFSFPSIF